MQDTRWRCKSELLLRRAMNQDSNHTGAKVLPDFSQVRKHWSRSEGASSGPGSSKLTLVTALVLFPFPDQGSLFPACHSKHPEKSTRRQTEHPGAHHSFPPWPSLPHQGGPLGLSSGDPRLSKRGVTRQEVTRKPYPDHHQHCQKTQPKHWGSSSFPICWHHCSTKTQPPMSFFNCRNELLLFKFT